MFRRKSLKIIYQYNQPERHFAAYIILAYLNMRALLKSIQLISKGYGPQPGSLQKKCKENGRKHAAIGVTSIGGLDIIMPNVKVRHQEVYYGFEEPEG